MRYLTGVARYATALPRLLRRGHAETGAGDGAGHLRRTRPTVPADEQDSSPAAGADSSAAGAPDQGRGATTAE